MAFKDILRKTHQHIKNLRGKMAQMKKSHDTEEDKFLEYEPVEKEHDNVQTLRIEIPPSEIAKVFFIALLFIAGVAFLSVVRDIVLIFFVALLFSAALDPIIDSLQARRVPRAVGVIIIYVVIIFILAMFVTNLVPLAASELGDLALKIQDLISNIANGNIKLPGFLEGFRPAIQEFFKGIDISEIGNYKDVLLEFAQRLTDVGKNVFNALLVTFNGLLNMVLVLVLTFLMVVDEEIMDRFTLSLFPARYGKYITEKSNAMKEKIGHWLRGQIALMIIVGALTYLGFLVIGLFTTPIQYATTLAMFAGVMEFVPYVGPVFSWIISMPIVANQSLSHVLWVSVLFIIVQQLENNLIVPAVMKKAVGLNPILSILAVLIGYEFLGVVGMVIAIPVATTAAIFVKDYTEREK